MKKILLLLCVSTSAFLCDKLSAQTYGFAFSQFTSTYVPLNGATNVYGTALWNTSSIANVPMGFNFLFMGQGQTSMDIVPGICAFPMNYDSMGLYAFFAGLNDTGTSISGSPVSYLLTGTAGNHILKLECKNAGFSKEFSLNNSYSSAVNFQTWFYESDHAIEVHMGPSFIANPANCYNDSLSSGPIIGPLQFNASQTALNYSLLLTGPAANPSTAAWNLANAQPAVNGTPADGMVYRFAEVISGINEAEQVFTNVGLFPNPANENATLFYQVKNAGDVNMQITDMQGRIVANEQLGMQDTGTHNYSVNTSELSNGIYFVTLLSGEQKIVQKLNVAH